MTVIGGKNLSQKQVARMFAPKAPEPTTALQIRDGYISTKLGYSAAHAQLTVFCGMGDHEAELFLASRDTTGDDTIRQCMNGWLSPSNAVRAMKALGIPADEAKARLAAAWEGK
jgi:hypothetical protein